MFNKTRLVIYCAKCKGKYIFRINPSFILHFDALFKPKISSLQHLEIRPLTIPNTAR